MYRQIVVPLDGSHLAEEALEQAKKIAWHLKKNYYPNIVLTADEGQADFPPLLQDKAGDSEGNALIYVCFDKVCQKPVATIEEAIKQFPTLA